MVFINFIRMLRNWNIEVLILMASLSLILILKNLLPVVDFPEKLCIFGITFMEKTID